MEEQNNGLSTSGEGLASVSSEQNSNQSEQSFSPMIYPKINKDEDEDKNLFFKNFLIILIFISFGIFCWVKMAMNTTNKYLAVFGIQENTYTERDKLLKQQKELKEDELNIKAHIAKMKNQIETGLFSIYAKEIQEIKNSQLNFYDSFNKDGQKEIGIIDGIKQMTEFFNNKNYSDPNEIIGGGTGAVEIKGLGISRKKISFTVESRNLLGRIFYLNSEYVDMLNSFPFLKAGEIRTYTRKKDKNDEDMMSFNASFLLQTEEEEDEADYRLGEYLGENQVENDVNVILDKVNNVEKSEQNEVQTNNTVEKISDLESENKETPMPVLIKPEPTAEPIAEQTLDSNEEVNDSVENISTVDETQISEEQKQSEENSVEPAVADRILRDLFLETGKRMTMDEAITKYGKDYINNLKQIYGAPEINIKNSVNENELLVMTKCVKDKDITYLANDLFNINAIDAKNLIKIIYDGTSLFSFIEEKNCWIKSNNKDDLTLYQNSTTSSFLKEKDFQCTEVNFETSFFTSPKNICDTSVFTN